VQSTGTIIPGTTSIGMSCDDCVSAPISLPFPVTIYGTTYNSVKASSNGNVQFVGANGDYSAQDLPYAGFDHTIFLLQTDLYLGGANGKGIFTGVTGASPNQSFIIEWRAVPCCISGGPDTLFEVIFHEGSETITVIYGAIGAIEPPVAGIQKDSSDFTQWAFSAAPTAGTRIDLTDDAIAPVTTDDVPPGWSNTTITVTLTATDASSGVAATYYTTDGTTPTIASSVYNPASKPTLTNGQTLKYFSVDNAGNAETVKTSAAAQIDTVAPVTTDDVPNGPSIAPFVVTLNVTDADSGVAATYYTTDGSNPTTASPVYNAASKPTLTNGQEIKYFSVDNAGNSETVKTSLAQVDTTARFVPVAPGRLLDTRIGNVPYAGGTVNKLQVAGRDGVPADAVAVILNVVATGPDSAGFLTVYPCGTTVPDASNLNFAVGDTVADSVTVNIGAAGSVCFYSSTTVHLVVDVNGAYSPSGTTSLTPMAPSRLLDTRVGDVMIAAGSIQELQVAGSNGVPDDAVAAVLNVTAVGATSAGYATVFPCGTPTPDTSNLNFDAGETIANSAVATIGDGGRICVYTSAALHLVVDVNGAFGPSGTASLAPLTPRRLLDTRVGGVALAAGSILELPVAGSNGVPADAVAAVLNVTAIATANAGYVTVFACGTPTPDASNLNFSSGTTIANSATVAIGTDGTVCFYTSATVHLLVDINSAYIAVT
jgi:hypothetical protein